MDKIEIVELDECPVNERNGTYGGQAGDKEGIIFGNNNWIVKYPKSTRGMQGQQLVSYMTAPLSEYIGSHVYSLLGYETHETMLGIRNGKLVVACKDFCKMEGALREIRTLKNVFNTELEKRLEENFSSTSSSHMVDLNELLTHFKYNPVLNKAKGLQERFWDCVVVDILINNNDRNNGNWGLLYENGNYRLAPIYDNGASFSNKYSDEKIREIMNNTEKFKNSTIGINTVYAIDEKLLSAKKLLSIKNNDLYKALNRNVPLIRSKMSEIESFINAIPEEYKGMPVCSALRKDYYLKGMEIRVQKLLEPALELHRNNYYQMQNVKLPER